MPAFEHSGPTRPGLRHDHPIGHTEFVLHTHRFGPSDGPTVLALHGITGHGRRWKPLANQNLAEAHVLAPDLLGHGRSSAEPPWHIEGQADALAQLLRDEATGPVLVVGHSFGGAVAVHLADRHPDLVRGLVLLDPAIAIAPDRILEIASATVASPDYTDVAEARAEKLGSDWGEVPHELLEDELAEHLVPTRDGRVGWRMSVTAVTAYYGELARPFVLPPAGMPTVLVRALQVQPPLANDEFVSALSERLGEHFHYRELDCNHMVPIARPAETEKIVRELL